MKRNVLFSAVITVSLVLSGCSAFVNMNNPTSTPLVTPAPVPDDPTSTPSAQIAPGVTKYSLINASILINSHVTTLKNRSFTVHRSWVLTYPNGTVAARSVVTIRVEGDNLYMSKTSTGFSGSAHSEIWYGDGRFLTKTTTNNSTLYNRTSRFIQVHTAAVPVPAIEGLDSRETDVTKLYSRNGTTFYRLNITARDGKLTVHARIDSRGLIHNYTVRNPTSVALVPNATHSITSVQYTDVGTTTVERPAWYAKAINKTSEQNDYNQHS